MLNSILYFNVATTYIEGNLVNFKNHIYMVKFSERKTHTNIITGYLPPEYPIVENEYWILRE
jgi:hypothetical protein